MDLLVATMLIMNNNKTLSNMNMHFDTSAAEDIWAVPLCNVSTQISLRSQHRLIGAYAFRLRGMDVSSNDSWNKKIHRRRKVSVWVSLHGLRGMIRVDTLRTVQNVGFLARRLICLCFVCKKIMIIQGNFSIDTFWHPADDFCKCCDKRINHHWAFFSRCILTPLQQMSFLNNVESGDIAHTV